MNRRHRQYLINFCAVSALLLLCHAFFIRQFGAKSDVVPYDEANCGCPRWAHRISTNENNSLCSDYSTSRGYNQKVVSYVIYGDPTNVMVAKKYYKQMQSRIDEVTKYYEDWIVRLYHNKRYNESNFHEFACNLYCQNPNFDLCQVGAIEYPQWLDPGNKRPNKIGPSRTSLVNVILDLQDSVNLFMNGGSFYETDFNIQDESSTMNKFTAKLIGKTWRFLVMADPMVSDFLIRDIDSYILPREVMAVRQWMEASNAGVHAMRDHPNHNGVILAGMWGGSRRRIGSRFTKMFQRMLKMKMKNTWDFDQVILRKIVWPDVQDSILIHDSYHCRNRFLMPDTVPQPFPTQRNGSLFVSWGPVRSKAELSGIKPCPPVCRPIDHQEWTFC